MITVLDDVARINENGAEFAGLDRYEARRQIVEALQARGDEVLWATTPEACLR